LFQAPYRLNDHCAALIAATASSQPVILAVILERTRTAGEVIGYDPLRFRTEAVEPCTDSGRLLESLSSLRNHSRLATAVEEAAKGLANPTGLVGGSASRSSVPTTTVVAATA
jgi:hypothetical protein